MNTNSILLEKKNSFRILNEIILWNPTFKDKIEQYFPTLFNITINKLGYVCLKSKNSNIIIIEKSFTPYQYGSYQYNSKKYNPKYEIYVHFQHICTIFATVYRSSTSYKLSTNDLYNMNILKSLPFDICIYVLNFL